MNHLIARSAIATLTAAAVGLAGCGGDDDNKTTGSAAQGDQVTATATATATQTATQTTPDEPVQREAVVPGEQATLETGNVAGLKVKVDKVVDPVLAAVDRAQPGKKLVGVFVTGQATKAVERTRTSALTSLETTDGKVSGIRVIADGDCAGGFSADELLSALDKPVTGCIGFEIPKKATPKSITIVLASPKGTQQATWDLPKAK